MFVSGYETISLGVNFDQSGKRGMRPIFGAWDGDGGMQRAFAAMVPARYC